MSSEGRSLILGRIRDVLGTRQESAADGHARIERTYARSASLSREAIIDLFIDRLQHYQVTVHRCSRSGIAGAVHAAAAGRAKTRLLVANGIDRGWLPPGLEFVTDDGLDYRDLDASAGVLTGCSLAIATTGTLILRHGAGEGRRALTLIPDYHLCVVLEEQVLHTVPEAVRTLASSHPQLVTTISGPSATADIEMTRIRGVHGPRTLDVILAASAAAAQS